MAWKAQDDFQALFIVLALLLLSGVQYERIFLVAFRRRCCRLKDVDSTPYSQALISGGYVMVDLFNQLANLLATLVKTEAREPLGRRSVTGRALKVSSVLFAFSTLESLGNLLAEVAIRTSRGLEGAPPVSVKLEVVEEDFLAERSRSVDPQKGEVRVKEDTFAPTLDRLYSVLVMLAKVHGVHFKPDRGGEPWRQLVAMKELRDDLTHPKLDLTILSDIVPIRTMNEMRPVVEVTFPQLFQGVAAIRWYVEQVINLLSRIYTAPQHQGLLSSFQIADATLWLSLLHLHKLAGLNPKVFAKGFPVHAPSSEVTKLEDGTLVLMFKVGDSIFQVSIEPESHGKEPVTE